MKNEESRFAQNEESLLNEERKMKNLPLPTKILHSPAKRVFFILH